MKMLNEEITQMLYTTIQWIGKKRIQTDITSSIGLSKGYTDIILDKCIAKLASSESNAYFDEAILVLSETLLHFMLTVCTLPSQRKIQVKNA